MTEPAAPQFQIVRNGDTAPADVDWSKGVENVQKGIADALNARNVAFLLGAGCPSLRVGGVEFGVPTMHRPAEEFCSVSLKLLAEAEAADPADDGGDDEEVELDEWEVAGSEGPTPAPNWAVTKTEVDYLGQVGVELTGEYARNLERLMEVLHSLRFVLNRSPKPGHNARAVMWIRENTAP